MTAPGIGSGSGGSGGMARGHVDPVYLCYVLLGAGTLFPWNALITAADYWEERFPGKHTDRLLTVTYLPVNLVVIAAMVHWHGRVRPRLRIAGGLLGFTLAISAVPLLDLAPGTDSTLAALLLLVAACGVCDGFAQGALFGEAATLPPRYTQALVAGTAVSGVVVCLLRVITKATLPDTPGGLRASANLYFGIAALVCATCSAVYTFVLPRLPAVQQNRQAALEAALHEDRLAPGSATSHTPHKLMQQQDQQQAGRRHSLDLELSFEDHQHMPGQEGNGRQEQQEEQQQGESPAQALLQGHHGQSSSSLDGGGGGDGDGGSSGAWLSDMRRHGNPASQHPAAAAAAVGAGVRGSGDGGAGSRAAGIVLSNTAVFRLIWRLSIANMLIYTVTLSIFPGVLAEDVHSAQLGSWYPVALITAFNFADWAGKSVPGVAALRLRNERTILAATCARVLFVPAFHFAAVGDAGPAVIGLLTLLLGTTNGYCTAVAMIEGPEAVPPAAAALAGNLMVLFLILGLCIGAAGGFLWLL